MPTSLTEAESALAAAQDAADAARLASEKATADAAALRASVTAGNSKITAADIAAADQNAELAALVHTGAAVGLPALSAAVAAARADEACDEVVTQLPQLGRDVAQALDFVAEALAPFIQAAERYDAFIEQSVHRLEKVATPHEVTHAAGGPPAPAPRGGTTTTSPFVGAGSAPADPVAQVVPSSAPARFSMPRHGTPRVDNLNLSSCRGPGQLATVLIAPLRALGASEGLLDGLKLLAAGAPQLPTP
jgi:hypothetical protein